MPDNITTPESAKRFPYYTVFYATGWLEEAGLREQTEDFQTAVHMARAAAEVAEDLADYAVYARIEGHTRPAGSMDDEEFEDYLNDHTAWDIVATVLPDGSVVTYDDSDDPDAVAEVAAVMDAHEEAFA